ncbi:MAG: LPXTG cell wall anchor domain-containing protein [Kurthia sp.]|nr:LPXTG cell wall anchor domain-containing protein [Candidatus Kurthia equi]
MKKQVAVTFMTLMLVMQVMISGFSMPGYAIEQANEAITNSTEENSAMNEQDSIGEEDATKSLEQQNHNETENDSEKAEASKVEASKAEASKAEASKVEDKTAPVAVQEKAVSENDRMDESVEKEKTASDEKEDVSKEAKNSTEATKEVEEKSVEEKKHAAPTSIINHVEMKIDGKKLGENAVEKVEIGQEFAINFSLAIPLDTFVAGDQYVIDLPPNFNADGIEGGTINELGSYQVKNGQIIITFSEAVENENGTTVINAQEYLEAGISITSEVQANETNELQQNITLKTIKGEEMYTLQFHPQNVDANLVKAGIIGQMKADGQLNTASKNPDTIQWTVTFNKDKATLKDAIFKDTFDTKKLELQKDTFKVTELEIALDGTITEGQDVTSDFTKQTDNSWKIKEGSDKAYKITYTTKIIDNTATSYKNDAAVTATNLNKTASKTFNVSRQPFLQKKGTATKTGANWTINYNYSNEELADAVITDKLSATQTFDENSLKVYPVTFNENGDAVVGKTAIDASLYNVKYKANVMEISFNEKVTTAYQVQYSTKLVDMTVDKNRTTENTVTTNGKSVSQRITNQANTISKSHSEDNFQDHTTKWTLRINKDNYAMKNAIVTDTFNNKNMSYIEGSAMMGNEKITPTVNSNGLEFNLGDINKEVVITYKTTLDTSKHTNFVNTAQVDWNGKYSSTTQSTLNIPNLVKYNGEKTGYYNWDESAKNYLFHWSVGFNYDLQGVKAGTEIFDEFASENMTLLADTLKIQEVTMKSGSPVATSNYLSQDYYRMTENKNGFTVTFLKDLPENKAYQIKYDTTDSDQVFESKYTNVARSTLYGPDLNTAKFTKNVDIQNGGKGIDKTGTQVGKSRTFDFQVNVNKSKSILPNVVVSDTLSSDVASQQDMKYALDTFNLKVAGTNTQIPLLPTINEEQTPDSNYYLYVNPENNSFKLIFPATITDVYELTYQVYFEGDKNTAFKNTAKLSFNGNVESLTTSSVNNVTYINNSSTAGWGTVVYKDLFVKKVDEKTGRVLAGAIFELYKTDDLEKVYRTATTDENGLAKFSNIRLKDEGTSPYILKEVEAPKHYEIAADYKKGKEVAFSKTNSLATTAFEVENTHEACELTIQFKNSKDKADIATDGKYDVYVEKDGEKVPYKDTQIEFKAGQASIKLAPGEYFLKQADKMNGFVSANEFTAISVTYDEEGTCSTEVAIIELVPVCDTVIMNVDKDSKERIKDGAQFVVSQDGKEVKTVTSNDGQIDLGQLPSGKYELKQQTAPQGYDLNTEVVELTIDAENCTTKLPTFENEVPKCDVTIINQDEDGQVITEGSEYKVLKDGEVIVESVKAENGKITVPNLPAGSYELVQIKVAGNYVLNEEPVKFTVNPEECQAVVIVNEFGKCDVTIINKDDDTNEVITSGSEYKLYKKDDEGKKVEVDVEAPIIAGTDGKIMIPSLERGDYILEQVTAPEHYEAAKELEFTVNAKECSATPLVVENVMTYCPATLVLIDEELAQGIEGAEFVIKDVDGKTVGESFTFGKDGKVISEPLRPGTYTIELVKEVAGYEIAKSTTFVITPDACGGTIEVTVKNTPNKCDVTIFNKDSFGEVITEDSTYKVEKVNEDGSTTVMHENVKSTDGKIKIEQLRPGNYVVTQTEAPDGYFLQDEPFTFEVLKDECLPEQTIVNVPCDFTIVYVGVKDSDATFTLYDVTNEKFIVAENIKVVDGKLQMPTMKPGQYELVQTTVPNGYQATKPIEFTVEAGVCYTNPVEVVNEVIIPPVEDSKPSETEEVVEENPKDSSTENPPVEDPKTPVSEEVEENENPKPVDEAVTTVTVNDEKERLKPLVTKKPHIDYEVIDATTGKKVYSGKSNDKGELKIKDLPKGTYQVIEKAKKLPQTGQSNTLLMSLVGLLIVILGALLVIRGRKHSKA